MIYSHQQRLLFIHVSRTGGSTISNHLQRQLIDCRPLLGQHSPLAAARDVLGASFDETFKFAFVRNPWDRFVSWYALIGRSTLPLESDRQDLIDPDSAHWNGFDAFLEAWSSEEVQIGTVTRPRLSQWDQLADAEGELLTDDLGRFETFATDVARLFAKAGLKETSLPRINASHHHHYSVYYSDFGRDLVEQVFHRDIEQFGYQFEAH